MDTPNTVKVLIAEDEDSFRVTLQQILLKDDSFDFLACDNGDEALEMLQQEHFDVILLDYRMPGRSGLNILQWMHEQKMDTPVIFLTGMGSENIAVEAMKLGAYDYIPKETFEKGHLIHLINSTRERYLFRKERALREQADHQHPGSVETLELLSRTVKSLGELLRASSAAGDKGQDQQRIELLDTLPPEPRAQVSHTFSVFHQQQEMMSFCSKSLLDLSRIVQERLNSPATNEQQDAELKKLLEGIALLLQRGPVAAD